MFYGTLHSLHPGTQHTCYTWSEVGRNENAEDYEQMTEARRIWCTLPPWHHGVQSMPFISQAVSIHNDLLLFVFFISSWKQHWRAHWLNGLLRAPVFSTKLEIKTGAEFWGVKNWFSFHSKFDSHKVGIFDKTKQNRGAVSYPIFVLR